MVCGDGSISGGEIREYKGSPGDAQQRDAPEQGGAGDIGVAALDGGGVANFV